jgi:iron complex outermembrane recepter protein
VKQQLRNGISFNVLVLLVLVNVRSQAYGAERVEPIPATTVKQWRSQLNNSLTAITEIRTRKTPQGIEIKVITSGNKMLEGIKSVQENNLIIDFPNAILNPRLFQGIPDSSEGISELKVTTLRGKKTVRMIVSGVEGAPTGKVISDNRGATINVISPLPAAEIGETDQVIDIIVTAQKQPEKPQDVPISLTTLPQAEIEDAKIDSFRDVAANTPNFFTTVSDRAFNFQTIRGLGNANFLSRDSISFFIDDVPYEYVHQFLPGALFDLERVEVLRGPQSTLYGRNSAAGVVNVISRQPTNSPEITLGASYGNFNQREFDEIKR